MTKDEEILAELRAIKTLLQSNSDFNKRRQAIREQDQADMDFYRDSLYLEHRDSILNQINMKTLDWSRIKNLFDFRTTGRAKMYIENRLREDGLIK